jgi:glycerol-3-phosphate dehydrogenase
LPRLSELDGALIDVVVIGGGIAGAGIARDLAHRGIPVVLFERRDFASGTTSRSSKLIHGGLRYLEQLEVGLVREALREREILRRLAPHLIRPTPFLLPVYRDSSRSLSRVRLGLALYDWLTPGPRQARRRVLRPVDTLAAEPGLRAEALRGAGHFVDDVLLSPERLCLENVLSAVRRGARAFNYCEVEDVQWGRTGVGSVRVRDVLSERGATVRARVVVNAAGPWIDRVREQSGIVERGRRVTRTTKGVHAVLPRLTERALYHSARDGRMVFVIPWRDFSLIGTTDTDFEGDPERVDATPDEVRYLLDAARRVLSDPGLDPDAVLYTYAGVRPLAWDDRAAASNVSRAHTIVTECDGTFLSATGAKLTTFRSLAAHVGDLVTRALGRPVESRTATMALDGADTDLRDPGAWRQASPDAPPSRPAAGTLEAALGIYARASERVASLIRALPDGAERLCPANPEVVGQLHYAVRHEMAVTLQDVLLRRTGIGTSRCQGRDCAESIARRQAALLGWTSRRVTAELGAWDAHVRRSQAFRTRAPADTSTTACSGASD